MPKNKVQASNLTLLLALSSAFEYYDFVIYGFMAIYLGPLFFPHDNELASQLQAFSVFALGYAIRPLGGIILGALGDLTGRARIFINSNFMLAIATLAISILPSYQQIGITATIAVIALRFLQAFSFSMEVPGAMTLIKESQQEKPGSSFSLVISAAALGSILASMMLYFIESSFSKQEILSFAWRIPFIFGVLLCVVSMILRRTLPNSNQVKHTNKRAWIAQVMAEYKKVIAYTLILLIPAYMIIMNLFFPSFLSKFYPYNATEISLAITYSLVWVAIYAPVFAYICGRLNQITLLQAVLVATILGIFILSNLLNHGHIIIALCLYQSLSSSILVTVFPLMAAAFGQDSRFTLMATCYNVAFAVIAFLPSVATGLAAHFNSPLIIWVILALLAVFALANMSAIFLATNSPK